MPKLPVFKTEEEFAQFVETHDMGEYWDEFEDVTDVKITIPKPPDEYIGAEDGQPIKIYHYSSTRDRPGICGLL